MEVTSKAGTPISHLGMDRPERKGTNLYLRTDIEFLELIWISSDRINIYGV